MHWFVICSDVAESTCLECPNLSRREQRRHLFPSFHSALGAHPQSDSRSTSLSEREVKGGS